MARGRFFCDQFWFGDHRRQSHSGRGGSWFELPVSAEVDSPALEIPVDSELPEGDIPEVSFETSEDMPTIEAGDTAGEIPEG